MPKWAGGAGRGCQGLQDSGVHQGRDLADSKDLGQGPSRVQDLVDSRVQGQGPSRQVGPSLTCSPQHAARECLAGGSCGRQSNGLLLTWQWCCTPWCACVGRHLQSGRRQPCCTPRALPLPPSLALLLLLALPPEPAGQGLPPARWRQAAMRERQASPAAWLTRAALPAQPPAAPTELLRLAVGARAPFVMPPARPLMPPRAS